jgi:hypothetical protein
MVGGMEEPTEAELNRRYVRAVRACDVHRMTLRSVPIDHMESHLR